MCVCARPCSREFKKRATVWMLFFAGTHIKIPFLALWQSSRFSWLLIVCYVTITSRIFDRMKNEKNSNELNWQQTYNNTQTAGWHTHTILLHTEDEKVVAVYVFHLFYVWLTACGGSSCCCPKRKIIDKRVFRYASTAKNSHKFLLCGAIGVKQVQFPVWNINFEGKE